MRAGWDGRWGLTGREGRAGRGVGARSPGGVRGGRRGRAAPCGTHAGLAGTSGSIGTGRRPRRVRKQRSPESRAHVFFPGACRELESFLSTLPCAQAGFAVHAGSCSFAARAMTACALGHGPALDGAAQRAQWVLQAEPPGRLSAPGGAILAQGRDGGTLPEEEVKIKLLFSGGRLGMFHLEKGRLQRHPRALKGLQDSWRGTLDEGLE